MKKIIFTILILIGALHSEPYRINGVKEFHRVTKNFIAQSSNDNIKLLTSEEILSLTIQLSSITLMVDELTDNKYLQGVLSAIEAYEDQLGKLNDDDNAIKTATAYLADLKKDMLDQNTSDLAGGTKAFKFDIDNLADDDFTVFELKREILKNGQKSWDKLFPIINRIDADIIVRANELKIDELNLAYITNPTKEEIESLLLFKGQKIIFPALKKIQPEALKTLAKFTGALEFNKLVVDSNTLEMLYDFKCSELRIPGLDSELNNILSEKLGKRYKKSILFKKSKNK